MAILFFEGLPGAGKSYEAMVTQIIPALRKGRHVVAYIEGLDHERIAAAADLPVDRVRELLHPLTRDDMRPREEKQGSRTVQLDGAWIDATRDDALHVFDEAQNWWPNRLRPTEALTQFVTEHRHRGIDVLLMGQSLLDVLALWRRRVDQKFTFLKLTALGSDKRYRVTVFKGQGNDEFVKVKDGFGKYDAKYFGTYASHVSDDTNTETYTDSRAVFWKGSAVRYGAVAVVVMVVWGGWKAWAFFHPESAPAKPAAAAVSATPGAAPVRPVVAAPAAPVDKPKDARSVEERYFADLSARARVRLSGMLYTKDRLTGVVEWVDGNTRVVERLPFTLLKELGVRLAVVDYQAVRLQLGEWTVLATMWPVEAEGRVSEYRQATIRPGLDGGVHAPAAPATPLAPVGAGSGLIVIGNPRAAPPAPASTSAPDRKTWTPGQAS